MKNMNRDDILRIERALAAIGDAETAEDTLRALSELPEPVYRVISILRQSDDPDVPRAIRETGEPEANLADIDAAVRNTLASVIVASEHKDSEADFPFRFFSRVTGLESSPFLALKNATPVIRLVFKTAEKDTFVSDQDLEDSLWIGVAILEAVANTVKSIEGLMIPSEKIEFGNDFEDHLDRAERALKAARSVHSDRKGG